MFLPSSLPCFWAEFDLLDSWNNKNFDMLDIVDERHSLRRKIHKVSVGIVLSSDALITGQITQSKQYLSVTWYM
jgi:phage terminase large subunit